MRKRAIIQAPKDDFGSKNRISQLPEEILVSILSRLTLKEAVRTGTLSKQWQHLWTHVTVLNFDAKDSLDIATADAELCRSERDKFINWVNRVMSHHRGPTLDQLKICFTLDKSSKQAIDDWVKFAITKSARKLVLNFQLHRHRNEAAHNYTVPLNILVNSISRQVSAGSTGLERLRDLTLKWVNVCDEALDFLLSRCLSLHSLAIWASRDLANVKISGGSSLALKHLYLFMCDGIESIEISNANKLASFYYFGASTNVSLRLDNVPALEKVFAGHLSHAQEKGLFQRISACGCISQLKTLMLHIRCPKESLSDLAFPQLPKLKTLKIVVEAWKDESLLDVLTIVEACQNLEKLMLKVIGMCPPKVRRMIQVGRKCALKSLRLLEIYGYYGRTSEIELVEHFIENAPSLEKISIDPKNPSIREDETLESIREEARARTHAERYLGPKVPDGVKLAIL